MDNRWSPKRWTPRAFTRRCCLSRSPLKRRTTPLASEVWARATTSAVNSSPSTQPTFSRDRSWLSSRLIRRSITPSTRAGSWPHARAGDSTQQPALSLTRAPLSFISSNSSTTKRGLPSVWRWRVPRNFSPRRLGSISTNWLTNLCFDDSPTSDRSMTKFP